MLVVADGSGDGGEFSLQTGGNLIGSVTAHRLQFLSVDGDVTETSAITTTHFHNLTVNGNLAGSVFLENGIPEGGSLAVGLELTGTGVVDLNHGDVSGNLSFNGGGAGSVVNGGTVTTAVMLGGAGPFAGVATFDSVGPTGLVNTEGGLNNPADLSGTIHVLGDVLGSVWIRAGDLLPTGRILIDGDMYGYTQVLRFFEAGNLYGEIVIGGDLIGQINVFGDVQHLGGSGSPIRVDGEMLGDARTNVYGSLLDETGTEIVVAGSMSSDAAIVIDFDGSAAGRVGRAARKSRSRRRSIPATHPARTFGEFSPAAAT